MVNVELLFEVINNSNFTIPALAKELKIDSSTLYRKIKKPESFTIKEVDSLVKILNLSYSKANAIFFSEIVA